MPRCPVCDADFVTSVDLDYHAHERHPAVADSATLEPGHYNCKACGVPFTDAKALEEHALVTHDLPS
jgi:hypothetical protein